jgi:hypothetical protein
MKKYLAVALVSFIIGCFSSSPNLVKNFTDGVDTIRGSFVKSEISRIDKEISTIDSKIELILQSYKVEDSKESKTETKIKETIIVSNQQPLEAGFGNIFGCTPSKPPEEIKKEVKIIPVEPPPSPPVPTVIFSPAAKIIVKSAIISVKNQSTLVNGKIILNKWNVKLNKEGLNKVKKGAKVRIFIGYCYYESDKIEKDGTVSFNIEWHPPLNRAEGKIGVSLFMQTNTPDIGSGIQYCSTIIRV